jgi:hypothetical protein
MGENMTYNHNGIGAKQKTLLATIISNVVYAHELNLKIPKLTVKPQILPFELP